MKNLDVFIIDPDTTFLIRLKDIVEQATDLSVVFTAAGEQHAEITDQLEIAAPDVLLLGINRPDSEEMDIFEEVRKNYPRLPIIILPLHSREGAEIALKTLKEGAVEYINKTSSDTGAYHTREHFRTRLIPVIQAMPRINRTLLAKHKNLDEQIEKQDQIPISKFDQSLPNIDLLTVAGCLGGIPALYRLLSKLPRDLPVPVLVVQHVPKIFSEVLAVDLNSIIDLSVNEAQNGSELKAGEVNIAPGGYHARIKRTNGKQTISLFHEPYAKVYRPSMDIMLESTSDIFKNRVLAIYLSGGGSDGIEGAKALDKAGSQIIIQNRQTSLLWDLPQKIDILAIDEGSYPLDRLGHQITERII